MDSCRLEKAFRHFGHDITDEDHVLEAGLGFAVKPDKGDFIGRAAAQAEQSERSKRQRVSFVVDADDAEAMGDEAVWKDGQVVGWITSGGYCHHVGCSYATGYVESDALTPSTNASWQLEILGVLRDARLLFEPLLDPEGKRMLA